MREWIGTCQDCGRNIYCENGFLNGVLLPGHIYRCFDCEEKDEGTNKKENQ